MAPSGRPDSALRLPRWVALWHVLGGAAALYDASFLLLRPASLPGGPLHPCFAPYTAYAAVDRAYGPEGIRDGLVNAHSWINVAEAAVGFVAVFLSGNRPGLAFILSIITSTSTLSKTVLYVLAEVCSGFRWTGHAATAGRAAVFALLSVWIFLPLLILCKVGSIVLRHLSDAKLKAR